MLRETKQDLSNEADILDAFCKHFKLEWSKLGNGGKYRIDAVLFKGQDPRAWAEVKDYKRSLFLGLNAPKFIEGCELANMSNIPFLLLFRHEGEIGYLVVHNGAWPEADHTLKMAGGTPKGREPLPDDIEPIYVFSKSQVKWLENKKGGE